MKYIGILLGAFIFACNTEFEHLQNILILSIVYGTTIIYEPVLIELIESPAFQRLKHIRQYGVMCHARPEQEYTRYQHSLGVFFITRKFGAPLEEQIAALLHDVSHTVFSHVGDRVFASEYFHGKDAYQDGIHEWYIETSGLKTILHKYGYDTACCAETKKRHHCFDQKLPNLCADRIEYNLAGGLIDGLLTSNEVITILEHLHFNKEQWFFDDPLQAKKFSLISIQLSKNRWGSAWSAFIDHSAAQALKRAYDIGLVTYDEIHFSVDDIVWQKLINSSDNEIVQNLQYVREYNKFMSLCNPEESDLYLHGKFSGTDPLIATENGLCRLSSLDFEHQQEFLHIKNQIAQGYHLKIVA